MDSLPAIVTKAHSMTIVIKALRLNIQSKHSLLTVFYHRGPIREWIEYFTTWKSFSKIMSTEVIAKDKMKTRVE